MIFKTLEDKCRYYQKLSDDRLMPNGYVIVHCDGRGFSKLVKRRFKLPFDKDFVTIMNSTAEYLCKYVQGCKCAFVQSDEITLILSDIGTNEMFFGGRKSKMISIIASMATAKFTQLIYRLVKFEEMITDDDAPLFQFDCKVWNVPSINDQFAWLLFRQIDCIKNSKQQTAQTWLSHKELTGKTSEEQIKLLKEKEGVDWNYFPNELKFGRFIVNKKELKKVNYKGNDIDVERSVWKAVPANKLTDGKEWLMSEVEYFKQLIENE